MGWLTDKEYIGATPEQQAAALKEQKEDRVTLSPYPPLRPAPKGKPQS